MNFVETELGKRTKLQKEKLYKPSPPPANSKGEPVIGDTLTPVSGKARNLVHPGVKRGFHP